MRILPVILAAALVAGPSIIPAIQAADPAQAPAAEAAELQAIAVEAYTYLYPMVTMDVSRRQLTGVPADTMPGRGPANRFVHMRAFPTADFREVVRPNFDTLYSSAWLDLTGGPLIITAPDTAGRFYLLPILDMWSDVIAVPGKRTTGTAAARFAVVPAGWTGTLPPGVQRIDATPPISG